MSAITVSDLTEKAGVARMTYYRNYQSKEDIFSTHLKDILEEYRSEALSLNPNGHYDDLPNMIHCFQYFKAHRDFLDCLFECGLSGLFLTALEEYILSRWQTDPQDPAEYYTLHAFSGALFNTYSAWSKRGAVESAEEIARIMSRFFRQDSSPQQLDQSHITIP